MNNNQNIKIGEALKRGHKRINIVCVSLAILLLIIVPLALVFIFRNNQDSLVLTILGTSSVAFGIILPIVWWLKETVNYKIWAGKNVKDIHRFHEETLSKNLITERPFFNKLEIKSSTQKKELKKFFHERLAKKREIVQDINSTIENDTVFKSNYTVNIIIFILLIGGTLYSSYSGYFEDRMTYSIIVIVSLLAIYEFYKMLKHNYILKINRDYISYKDDSVKLYWKDIIAFQTVKASQYNSAKLHIDTHSESYILQLEGIGNFRLNKVLDVLNENKHRYQIKESVN